MPETPEPTEYTLQGARILADITPEQINDFGQGSLALNLHMMENDRFSRVELGTLVNDIGFTAHPTIRGASQEVPRGMSPKFIADAELKHLREAGGYDENFFLLINSNATNPYHTPSTPSRVGIIARENEAPAVGFYPLQ